MLASTSLAVFAVFLDTTILFVAFPSISATSRRRRASTLSWVLNAYTIVFAALLIPAGRLADRIGRRKTFLAAVVMFTVASMLCGLAPTAGLLIVARVLQAVGAAALVPASLALVLQTFPRDKIPVAVAIWGAVGAVAGAAGPTLGALVVENLGWRWAFFINLPVGIVSFMLGRRVLPEGQESNPGRLPDPLERRPAGRRAGPAAYAIVQTSDWGWASAPFIGTDGGRGAPRRLPLALQPGVQPAARPGAVPVAVVPLGQRRHVRLRHRVQRHVPRQRAVPHAGVGLLDPARRPGHLDRTADRRRAAPLFGARGAHRPAAR